MASKIRAAAEALKFWKYRGETQFEEVGEVSQLYFYPVKSCQGFLVKHAVCTSTGLEYCGVQDRSFMFCTANGHFITQRFKPRLSLIKPSLHFDTRGNVTALILRAPDMPDLRIDMQTYEQGNRIRVRIWGRDMEAEDCEDDAGQWVDDFLGLRGCRLVFSPQNFGKRSATAKYNWIKAQIAGDEKLSFQDRAPILLTTTASIDDISSSVSGKVQVDHFRPNIVVRGNKPFEEDKWSKLKIAKCEMHGMWLHER